MSPVAISPPSRSSRYPITDGVNPNPGRPYVTRRHLATVEK
jgi:hypothetical protein